MPFTEGAQYGIELFYPFDNELRASRGDAQRASLFTVSRSQNRFLKNIKSTPPMTAIIATTKSTTTAWLSHIAGSRLFENSNS